MKDRGSWRTNANGTPNKVPCEERLKQPPPCNAPIKERAPYVMCIAKKLSEERNVPIKMTLKDAWHEFKKKCEKL